MLLEIIIPILTFVLFLAGVIIYEVRLSKFRDENIEKMRLISDLIHSGEELVEEHEVALAILGEHYTEEELNKKFRETRSELF